MSKNAVCALSFMLILMICLLLLICHDEINVQNVPIRILSLSVEGMEYYVYQTTLSQTVFGGRLSKNHAQTRSSGVSESRFEVQYISVSRSQNHRPRIRHKQTRDRRLELSHTPQALHGNGQEQIIWNHARVGDSLIFDETTGWPAV